MMFASLLNPFIVLIFNQIVYVKLFAHISFGGHSAGVVFGAFILLIELILLNSNELIHWLKNPASDAVPERKE